MKKLKYLYLLVTAMFIASSCTDFVDPAIPYDGFETGTYLKTITAPSAHNFFDLDNAKFGVVLECHAADKINNVKTVDVMIRHRRGNTLSPEVKLSTIEGSSFTTTADSKWPRSTVSATVNEVLTKMGMTKAGIKGGDFIEYRLILNTLDNKVFTNTNLSGNIVADPYYNSPFLYRVAVVCPSDLAGVYDYVTKEITGSVADGANPAACGESVSGKSTFTAGAVAGEYIITDGTFGQYGCAWGDNPATGSIRFTDACNKIGMKGSDQYGLVYKATYISHNDKELTFKWENDFGDSGVTTLTRSTGAWPKGLN